MTVSESLLQIAELTKQNLQILKVLNDSFYTKSNHLSTVVGDTTYTIPSYIALENKVNHVQDAINNLVHAAKSGEAWFNFDGNSKEIRVRGYQSAPSPVNLTPKTTFETETRQIFKDMLTPQPYLNFDMSRLPDDIHQVLVKKVIPYHSTLIALLRGENLEDATKPLSWADFQRILLSADREFVPGDDYLEYESVYELPVRNCTRSGQYVIEEVLTDQITENYENVITVRISDKTPLKRIDFDGLNTSDLQAGDSLITFDGSAKLKIRDINIAARTMTLLIVSGEYVNPIAAGTDIKIKPGKTVFDSVSDYSILKLYSSMDTNRELHIPLEEDSMVYMTVAPINPRLNTQSAWGTGLLVNTDKLKRDTDENEDFRTYYNNNVSNIGDAMVELSTIAYPSITRYSSSDWKTLIDGQPGQRIVVPDDITFEVVQVNKHLNDSDAVKNIRALYSQKKQYQTDLAEIQARIASLTESLAEISFDDMSGVRSAYTAQISELKDQQNNIITSINKIVDNISLAANNAEIPIEDGKFRIRGYYDVNRMIARIMEKTELSHDEIAKCILGIEVRYRYRNAEIPQANVSVIGNEFLFTEWATYQPPLRERTMTYEDGRYKVIENDSVKSNGEFNYSDNVPKFNQIEIPISQGENVEFQVRVIWGFGHPFVKVSTHWSNSIEATFPPELVKDVQVTTIIEENNSDIETNRFETILRTNGVTPHIDDSIDDQDVKFFHKPESISSGFYTPERRIIPLKDKLIDMDSKITEVTDMIQGTTSEALSVQCVVDNVGIDILADVENVIQLPAYGNIKDTDGKIPTGSAYRINGVVYIPATIVLKNQTKHTVNLFSVMPGARSVFINDLKHYRYPIADFVTDEAGLKKESAVNTGGTLAPTPQVRPGIVAGDATVVVDEGEDELMGPVIVWTSYIDKADKDNQSPKPKAFYQRANQIITYRRKNPYDDSRLSDYNTKPSDYEETHNNEFGYRSVDGYGMWVWPIVTSEYGMCLTSDAVNSKLVLAPGESISFALQIEYCLNADKATSFSRTIGFNVRNSLYLDPLYYQIQFVAKFNQSTADMLSSAKTSVKSATKYNITVR